MKQNSSKLKHQEQHSVQEQQAAQQQTPLEFRSPEDLLRHDASQVVPPPQVAKRLNESVAREPKPARRWWQKFLPS